MRIAIVLLLLLQSLRFAVPAGAQQVTGLTSVFPPGGQKGKTTEVRIAGDDVTAAATSLWFSHPGITASKVAPGRFALTVGAEVPVGLYDVRAAGPRGVTDARTFAVGDLPEVVEKEPNNTPAEATTLPSLPVIVNGTIDPAQDIDFYRFHADAGQRLVIDFEGARIDATPAQAFIFDGTLELTSAGGELLASNTDFNWVDPFLDVTIPASGDYLLKVWDFTYRGSGACVYRIRIGAVPYVDYVFPAGGRRGTRVPVTFGGRNLTGGQPTTLAIRGRPLEQLARTIDLPKDSALPEGPLPVTHWGRTAEALTERISVNVSGPGGTSNSRVFMVSDLPEVMEKEPNDTPETATPIAWPCVVNGQADRPGDLDYFAFTARKGQALVFELFAQRLGSPMDSTLRIYSADGKLLAENDDLNAGMPGDIFFSPGTTDSRINWTAPTDGSFRVMVRDLYSANRGGPEFVYRLEVRPAEPDFRVVVVPDHRQGRAPDRQQVPRGGRMEWMIYAQRRNGFNGEIHVRAQGLPPGVTMEPAIFGPNVSQTQVVLSAAPDTPPGTFAPITLVAEATVPQRTITRQVQIAAITGPTVNTPTPQRLGRSAVVSVTEPAMFSAVAQPLASSVPAGAKLAVKVALRRQPEWNNPIELTPPTFGLPNGISMSNGVVPAGKEEATVELVIAKNVAPGQYAVTLNVSGQVPQSNGGNRRETYPSSAIVFTVTPTP